MPNKINQYMTKIRKVGAELIHVANEYDNHVRSMHNLMSAQNPLSWDELQRRLFPNAVDQMCPRIFLGIDEWKCTCECAACRKKQVPTSVMQILSDFHFENPFIYEQPCEDHTD